MKKAILIWFFGTVCSLYAGTNQIQIVSGNGQETRLVKPRLTSDRTSGEARFRPIVVRLLDKEGRGIEGKKIQFSASGPAGMSIQTMGTTIPITNAAGEATLPGILCFHTIGKVKVTVSAENAAAAIVELEVLLPADELPAEKIHLLFLSGNEQRVEILQHADGVGADFKPIRVQIRESSGKPAPFVFVTFSAPAGLQINREIRSNTAIVRADAEGIAELNMLGNRSASTKMSGNYTIQVTMGKASGSITLEAIARLRPNANHLEIVSGNNQKIRLAGSLPESEKYPGEARFGALKVRLRNNAGAPVQGAVVRFVGNSPGIIAVKSIPASSVTHTDSNGEAMLANAEGKSIRAYYGIGKVMVTVITDDSDPITFELEVLPREN